MMYGLPSRPAVDTMNSGCPCRKRDVAVGRKFRIGTAGREVRRSSTSVATGVPCARWAECTGQVGTPCGESNRPRRWYPVRILNRSNVGGRGIASAAITHRIGDLPGDTDPAGLPRVARSSGYSGVLGLLLLALTFSGYYLGYQKGYTAGEQEMKTFLESAIPNLRRGRQAAPT